MNEKYFAEIIESSLDNWTAQCWKWDQIPDFGSIVVVQSEDKTIFSIVHQIQTGSIDSSRQPFAYAKTEEQLKKEQPQIFEFLRTTFSCLVLGYQENNKIYYNLALKPVRIHSFVANTTNLEMAAFLKSHQYLQLIFAQANKIANIDELLLALLKAVKQINSFDEKQIDEFIEIYSLLTCNDYRRLKLFLQRL